jgi:ABC-type transporter lipoprotein component MlaA
MSYRTRLGEDTSIVFDENDEGVQMLKSRNIKRFSQQKLTEVENRLRVLNHHDKTLTKRNVLQEKLVEKYFTIRKTAKKEHEEAEEAIRAFKTNESQERKEKVLRLKYAWA